MFITVVIMPSQMCSKAIQELTIGLCRSQFSFQQQPEDLNPDPPFKSRLQVLSHLVRGFYWRNQSSSAQIFKDVAV